jgi:glycosyltransferase involved in cell wall biosynthesis
MMAQNRNHPPSVSVITPFYNRADYFRQVVDTLDRQVFRDFELIVVDDGSEDDLRPAIAKVETEFPIRLIRLDCNTGAASARNCGIENARGRYVAFLDSDDAWMPEKLLSQFRQLENANNRSVLVGLTRQLVIGARTYEAPRRLLTQGDSIGEYLFRRGGIVQSSMMFMTTDLARSVRFVDGGRGHDDWSFALRLEQAGAHFEMLPAALTIYNNAGGRTRRSPTHSQARFDWLEQWRGSLGEGPYLAARAAFVSHMSMDQSPHAPHVIGTAFLRGAIPPWRAAYYAATLVFPSLRKLGVFAKEVRLGRGSEAVKRHRERVEWRKSGKGHPGPGSGHRG